ncbi:MAG TPA: UPF0182 family protein [Tepidimicrobium sp.]|nr:UPF0182 family protein [Tepidimicrobium sp.]
MKNKSIYVVITIIALLLILLGSFSTLLDFATDYKWFQELGYTKTFLTKLSAQFKIGVPIFTIIFIAIFSYIMFIKKRYYREIGSRPSKNVEGWLNISLGLVSGLTSMFISSIFVSNLWFSALQFMNKTSFNIKDPVFNKDLSFYIFALPLFKEIVGLLFLLIAMMIILSIILYIIMLVSGIISSRFGKQKVFDMDGRPLGSRIGEIIDRELIKNVFFPVGILASLFFLVLAINYYLNSYELLYSTRGVVYGAGFTDANITLWIYRIAAMVSILSAIMFLRGTMKGNIKGASVGPVILLALLILGNVGNTLVQRFIVEPDEISKEQKYLEHHMEYTQRAYGLKDVEQRDFPVDQDLTREDLANNEDIIGNIRINDYRPIKQVYNQLQAIRLYYNFNGVDIDRYNIDGKYTQVFLSARELNQENLQTKTWINKHLKYTHGYGVALSPVNAIAPDGQPELLIKDIPPVTDVDLEIKRPEIYFGESTNDYIIVNTDEMEFDYPEGSDNKQTMYEGTAGIELKGLNRLLFAIKEKSYKLLISKNINRDSRIIKHRNINKRIRKIAPFIEYDENPYIVVNQQDGKLYWIIDGYTVSERYPYSKPFSEESNMNYIRNSVKVVVDAYNGDVKYYVFDEEDPIIRTYMKIFPELFSNKSEMPDGLMEHTKYPTTLFNIQAEIYKNYHVENPMVFYNEEDLWDIAQEKYMGEVQYVEPIYQMFRLPDADKLEFLLTIPYTPKTKPNMTSLLVARNDGEDYGKLLLYKFPKGRTIQGPMMIESRIDQNTEISEQLTLWSQEGSKVLRGNVIIVPIENSLLYVEPIYLEADSENSFPEVKRVIVAFEDKIVMERSLEEALDRIFGKSKEAKEEKGEEKLEERLKTDELDGESEKLIKKAIETFNKAKSASQEGNWAEYGKYIEELEDILNKLDS